MLLYLSQDTLNQRILDVNEGLRRDELTVRFDPLVQAFFAYVAQLGVTSAGIVEAKGNFALLRVNLGTADRAKVSAALDFIQPLAVTIEKADLAALIPSRLIQSAVSQSWPAVEKDLQRISTAEIWDKLESAAIKTVNGKQFNSVSEEEKAEREALAALKAAGIRDPLESFNSRDESNRRERDVQWQENERWLDGDYQEPVQPGETRCQHNLPLEKCVICFS